MALLAGSAIVKSPRQNRREGKSSRASIAALSAAFYRLSKFHHFRTERSGPHAVPYREAFD